MLRLKDGTVLPLEVTLADADPLEEAPDPSPVSWLQQCANCDAEFECGQHATPYCSLRCKDLAKAVRYTRGLLQRDPAAFRGGLPYECRIKIAHALSGGYPGGRRQVPPTVRAEVRIRDGDRCVLCGDAGAEVDHIDGDANTAENLRLLCAPCHRAVTEQRLRPIQDPGMIREYGTIVRRIRSPQPERPCDGPTWSGDWRRWSLAHRRPAKKPRRPGAATSPWS